MRVGLGEGNDLRGEDQARAESNQKGVSSLVDLSTRQHPVHGQRNRRSGGVPGGDDVAGNRNGIREFEGTYQRVGDAVVGLVGHEAVEVVDPDAGAVEEVFVNVNPQSTLKLGQARGVAMVALARSGSSRSREGSDETPREL